MRFSLFYPVVFIMVGASQSEKIDEVYLFSLPLVMGFLAISVSLIEVFYPDLVSTFKISFSGAPFEISNFRSRLGLGLTSLFASRVE